ncbi:MAG: cell division protein ZapA [Syntrophobacterales bacterium]|nr:cell division protein ZapA [Syntrophobacterales bacterium]
MKRSFHIEIMGQQITVLSDANEETVEKVVQYVNGRIEEVVRGGNRLNTLAIAALAALNIADELFKVKEENISMRRELEGKTQRLIDLIDEVNHT